MQGDFYDKNVIIFDDEISAGTTLQVLAKEVEKAGCQSLTFAVVHGLFTGNAVKKFQAIKSLKEIIVTDTIPIAKEVQQGLPLKIIPIDQLLAKKIKELVNP